MDADGVRKLLPSQPFHRPKLLDAIEYGVFFLTTHK
jgi:hypothetical protein